VYRTGEHTQVSRMVLYLLSCRPCSIRRLLRSSQCLPPVCQDHPTSLHVPSLMSTTPQVVLYIDTDTRFLACKVHCSLYYFSLAEMLRSSDGTCRRPCELLRYLAAAEHTTSFTVRTAYPPNIHLTTQNIRKTDTPCAEGDPSDLQYLLLLVRLERKVQREQRRLGLGMEFIAL